MRNLKAIAAYKKCSLKQVAFKIGVTPKTFYRQLEEACHDNKVGNYVALYLSAVEQGFLPTKPNAGNANDAVS